MKKKEAPVTRAPGRPRSDESRAAILKAAYQILREGGFAKFTVEGVAARAGAGKATIYRWWSSKGTLAVEAFLVALAPKLDAYPQTADPVADLRAQLHEAAAIYRGRAGQLLRELIALGQADAETGKLLDTDFLQPRRQAAMATLRRAEAGGAFRKDVDIDVVADALWGPIFHRLLVTRDSIDRKVIDRLADIVLDGALRRPRA